MHSAYGQRTGFRARGLDRGTQRPARADRGRCHAAATAVAQRAAYRPRYVMTSSMRLVGPLWAPASWAASLGPLILALPSVEPSSGEARPLPAPQNPATSQSEDGAIGLGHEPQQRHKGRKEVGILHRVVVLHRNKGRVRGERSGSSCVGTPSEVRSKRGHVPAACKVGPALPRLRVAAGSGWHTQGAASQKGRRSAGLLGAHK